MRRGSSLGRQSMGSYSASAQHLVDEMRAVALAEPARGLAFQGAPGANSDLAAREYDPNSLPMPCYAFEDAIDAVPDDRVDRAIYPPANRMHGATAATHVLLSQHARSDLRPASLAYTHCFTST